MNSNLELYSGDDAFGKLIEYGNIIRNEGYKASQIWQSEEEYERIGVNFSSEDREEFLFLEKVSSYEVGLEISCKYEGDTDKLIQLYHLIKTKETK